MPGWLTHTTQVLAKTQGLVGWEGCIPCFVRHVTYSPYSFNLQACLKGCCKFLEHMAVAVG